jgi:uncharacterized protein (DUF1800 family)
MDAKPTADPVGQTGQIEMLRRGAFGSFRTLLLNIAQDPAMLIWLDGISNVKAKPQENFARELMELFTIGVGEFAETDVYAGRARVHRVESLTRLRRDAAVPLPIQARGARHRSQRLHVRGHSKWPAHARVQPHPGTRRRQRHAGRHRSDHRARQSPADGSPPGAPLLDLVRQRNGTAPDSFVESVAGVYLNNQTSIRATLRAVLTSAEFTDTSRPFQRYAWPAEFVVRSLREIGWVGFSANDALTPLASMGQTLYEPPDVSGWDLGSRGSRPAACWRASTSRRSWPPTSAW